MVFQFTLPSGNPDETASTRTLGYLNRHLQGDTECNPALSEGMAWERGLMFTPSSVADFSPSQLILNSPKLGEYVFAVIYYKPFSKQTFMATGR